jgi:hypothetical protein
MPSDDELMQHWYLVTSDGQISEISDDQDPMALLADAPDGSKVIRSNSIEGARAWAAAPKGPPPDAVRWMLVLPEDDMPIVVVVIDDSEDDAMATAFAEENMVPSDRFGGLWTHWTDEAMASFAMIELGAGDAGVHRGWQVQSIDDRFLAAIGTTPHLVVLIPAELAGDARTFEDLAPRLQGGLFIQVEHKMRGPFGAGPI